MWWWWLRLRHLQFPRRILGWTSSLRSKFCRTRFFHRLHIFQPRKIRLLANLSLCPWPHLSTPVPVADISDEDVLAVALIGHGSAAVSLIRFQKIRKLFQKYPDPGHNVSSYLARVLPRLSAGADLAVLYQAHRGGALGGGHHGHRDLQQHGGRGAAVRGCAPAVHLVNVVQCNMNKGSLHLKKRLSTKET